METTILVESVDQDGNDLEVELTRATFEIICKELFESLFEPVTSCL